MDRPDKAAKIQNAVLQLRDRHLGSSANPLLPLSIVIYQVRCNLVHGDKKDIGDDEEVIRNANPILREMLIAVIDSTERRP